MSIGEFSILLSLSRTSMRGIKYFFSMGKNLQETKASFDRISKIVCASVPKDGTYKLVEIHSINLTGLNFQYRSKVVFKNLNYSFMRDIFMVFWVKMEVEKQHLHIF